MGSAADRAPDHTPGTPGEIAGIDRADLRRAVAALLARLAGDAGGLSSAVTLATGVDRSSREVAARNAARAALGPWAGATGWDLHHEADGRVTWPEGTIGSLSHCAPLCAAVCAADERHRGVGVDIEHDAALPADEARWVLCRAEQATVQAHPRPDQLATALWSAKEAAFKAWSQAMGGLAGVDPADITVRTVSGDATGGDGLRFAVHLVGDLRQRFPDEGPAVGVLAVTKGMLVTVAVVPRVGPRH